MLHQLSADYAGFKTLRFGPGLNLIIADTTPRSSDRESRNSAGKSSVIELLHFLLGARVTKNHVATRKDLRRVTFELALDWPNITNTLTVRRSGARPEIVVLDPDVS